MTKVFQAWIKGWAILIRLWLFLFIAMFPAFLLRHAIGYFMSASADGDDSMPSMLWGILSILVLPFFFYIASRSTGEFRIPKQALNQMMTREAFRRGLDDADDSAQR